MTGHLNSSLSVQEHYLFRSLTFSSECSSILHINAIHILLDLYLSFSIVGAFVNIFFLLFTCVNCLHIGKLHFRIWCWIEVVREDILDSFKSYGGSFQFIIDYDGGWMLCACMCMCADVFVQVEVSLYLYCAEKYYHEWVLDFVKFFFGINWYVYIIFFPLLIW